MQARQNSDFLLIYFPLPCDDGHSVSYQQK